MITFRETFDSKNFKFYCEVCEAYVCDSSKHCGQCNRCVNEFDHHCKWLGTCIGGRNYKTFILFLASLVAALWIVIVESLWYLYLLVDYRIDHGK